ncbi:hypothetical protein EVAR_18762_1 [Eumeta japonica]|uniref:Uncharacterized protein n=1 Tax=Eumeta variegata TaxID=151549 RepID=A0A4C1UNB4_EUMVA|nr:hypothetical protein EVAR_18762_1 [Eumeta japonica]
MFTRSPGDDRVSETRPGARRRQTAGFIGKIESTLKALNTLVIAFCMYIKTFKTFETVFGSRNEFTASCKRAVRSALVRAPRFSSVAAPN